MDKQLDFVNVVQTPGLYRVGSSSSTVYYVDSRGDQVVFMRARGSGATMAGGYDNEWFPLLLLHCLPTEIREGRNSEEDILADSEEWVLRVGHRHRYIGDGPYEFFWWVQRVCEWIEPLDEMPGEDDLTVTERLGRDDL